MSGLVNTVNAVNTDVMPVVEEPLQRWGPSDSFLLKLIILPQLTKDHINTLQKL